MAKNNDYGNYILSDEVVDYRLFGYNNRDLTKYKHEFISEDKLVIHYLDKHVERPNSNPYIRKLPFYRTICDVCNDIYWRKKSYDNYKRNMCSFKCQGNALAEQVTIRSFEHPGINSWGYPCFRIKGKQTTCHRYTMELHLGRQLTSEEMVHHIDMDKLNYDISNLFLCTRESHIVLHGTYNELCSELMNNYDKYCSMKFNKKEGKYYLKEK